MIADIFKTATQMSGDINTVSYQMVTNDFATALKSLPFCSTSDRYAAIIERLTIQLKQATPNGLLLENKPFLLAIVDNLYRIIPIFDKKLSDVNDSSRQTNLFLETLANACQGLCLFNLFFAIKDSYRLDIIFHNYIPLLKQSYFTHDSKYDHLLNCLLPIITSSSPLVAITENDLAPNMFSYLLDFVKINLKYEERAKLINNILHLVKVSSILPKLTPMVINSDWPNACIQWMKRIGRRPLYTTDFLINLILQKLARNAAAVDVLNQLNCDKALTESNEQMKKDHNEEEYSSIYFVQCIIHALLIEAKEIKQKSIISDERMCHVLEQMISFLISTAQNDSIFYKGCHISEILCVLCKLFINDDILKKCLNDNHGLLDCLSQLLIQYAAMSSDSTRIYQMLTDETLLGLVNLLWSISFHESYHENLKSNVNLMQTLSNIATSSSLYTSRHFRAIPRDVSSLKQAAEGILWNLRRSHLTVPKEKLEEKSHIMISYSHCDSTFCRELVDNLSHRIPVWVDYKQKHLGTVHSDDLWEEIAGAMETATTIVVIVSKDYYDSKSCRQELSYACDTLKKRIVPIYAPNQKYKASGWLGIRIAGQKYVHFGRNAFTDALNELMSILTLEQNFIAAEKSSDTVLPTETKVDEKRLKTWTTKDIRQWFLDNHIQNDLTTLLSDQFHTGTALIIYARHLKQFYHREYAQVSTNYYNKFNGKRLQTLDYITFVDALWRLREEYDPESKTEDISDRCNSNSVVRVINSGSKETIFL
ncbi:unnamed protein product [Rotaria socialis]|uniref:TIR domain-containing protein n=1 Tax=Rotaria socialis TaxID=392032 RepID=A0A818KJY4_9BILA|nr:unnamed protein product [Rotaria socialis]